MDIRSLLRRHGEKFTLAAALIVLAVCVARTTVESADARTVADVENALVIETLLDQSAPPMVELRDFSGQNRRMWEEIAAPRPATTWSVYRPTVKKLTVVDPDPPPPLAFLCAPVLRDPQAAVGKITLEWEPDPKTTAPILGYWVWRKGPQGEWKLLSEAPLGAKMTSFVDNTVEPETAYSYKIQTRTNAARTNNKSVDSEALEIASLGLWRMRLRGGSERIAQIAVTDRRTGEEWTFSVRPGEKIGREVAVNARKLVDFSTDNTLKEIRKERRKYIVKVKERKIGPGGIIIEQEVEKEVFKTELRIYYEDARGVVRDMWAEGRG
ncbi:MAG: fibronectin type III domain-containing protein [Planctomycetota bacterium]|nr:fibronectin type III domain-containing protein [Planctomycetota bacterium]